MTEAGKSVAPRLAAVTCSEMPELDAEWTILSHALEADGWEVSVQVWDNDGLDWGGFDVVLVRVAAWAYIHQPLRFLAWAEDVAEVTTLVNPARALRWNHDKVYLADLAGEGLPIVETAWVLPEEAWSPPDGEFVIKPTRSAGGFESVRYSTDDFATAGRHVQRLHEMGQTVMVQPYQHGVDAGGETSLVFIETELTHAVRKQALLHRGAGVVDRLWERERIELIEPSAEAVCLGEEVMDSVRGRLGDLSYARVDLLPGQDGRWRVCEVELIDPSLFFDLVPAAAGQLARELRARTRHR